MTRWCNACVEVQEVVITNFGFICCARCGKVIDQDILYDDRDFVKDSYRQSPINGASTFEHKRESLDHEKQLNLFCSTMTRWCDACVKVQEVVITNLDFICCSQCGKVIGQDDEPNFIKDSYLQSQVDGVSTPSPTVYNQPLCNMGAWLTAQPLEDPPALIQGFDSMCIRAPIDNNGLRHCT